MLVKIILSVSLYFIINLFYDIFFAEKKLLQEQLLRIEQLSMSAVKSHDVFDLPFHQRAIKPILDYLILALSKVLPLREESQKELEVNLSQAGIFMSAKEYRSLNILIVISMGLIFYFVFKAKDNSSLQNILNFSLGLFAGFVYRRFDLESKKTKRQEKIESQLPEVMDVLSVSVVAGLSFYQALERVVEKTEGPLIDEFAKAQKEISLGRPRAQALDNLALRTDVANVQTFVSAVNQADELGISLQNVLNTQSELIRDDQRQKIEEKAAKIPVKILLPMVLFIFPVIFIVLLGPAIPSLLQALGGQ